MGDKTFVGICKKGTLEEVGKALANGADVNERETDSKMTSLVLAVRCRNEPLVSLLLQQPGIQVNAKDNVGHTALHYAALFCSGTKGRKVIKLLLNFPGIDTEITSNSLMRTPLMLAKKQFINNKIFVEEYQKKMDDDNAKAIRDIRAAEKVETAGNNQMARKRKRESSDDVPHQLTSMWERLKTVKTRQKSALEEAAKKRKEKEEELVKMEEKMVEELDKEFEDKMAALVKEKQDKRAEIAEKVKVKQERQAQVDQETLAKLEKEHKAERKELMEEMWGQAEGVEEAVPQYTKVKEVKSKNKCKICFKYIKGKPMSKHLRNHKEPTPLKCKFCPKTSATKHGLDSHEYKYHKKNKTSTINPTQPACHLLLRPLTVPSALNQ